MGDYLKLKKSNCKNCYKCIRHCPVKAISFSGDQAHILPEECILCGQCFVVCPQNAKEIRDDLPIAKALIKSGASVVASIAPSFIANYEGVGIRGMKKALLALGFADVQETALGATMVKREYDRLVEKGQDVILSSCCPTVNYLVRKYFPDCLGYLADVVTPMMAHCLSIKRENPAAKTVFIGPCLSKKAEAEETPGVVDCVLTFEDLTRWLTEEGITPEQDMDRCEESRARWFAVKGGILKSMDCVREDYTYLSFDGIEECIHALTELSEGRLSHCFIELSACESGCVGGPVMEKLHRSPVRDYQKVSRYAGGKDFPVPQPAPEELHTGRSFIGSGRHYPSEAELTAILRKMGKFTPEQELNCGSCGYNSCRDKAIAIYQGKADASMCLPFLKERAESFSNHIINHSPSGILALNDKLEIEIVNEAAAKILGLRRQSEAFGMPIVDFMSPVEFMEVLQTGHSIRDKRILLPERRKTVELSVVYDKEFEVLIGMLRDVTKEEMEREKKETICRKTVETADHVVEKQMRVVQEIASLLGETAAETKIALTKLKESMIDE